MNDNNYLLNGVKSWFVGCIIRLCKIWVGPLRSLRNVFGHRLHRTETTQTTVHLQSYLRAHMHIIVKQYYILQLGITII